MGEGSGPRSGWPGAPAHGVATVSALFAVLWEAMSDLLGTAATATLLKRAARRAAVRHPELAELRVEHHDLGYRYTAPPGWSAPSDGKPAVLRALIGELRPLLVEMTGQLVVKHLQQRLELRELMLPAREEESP